MPGLMIADVGICVLVTAVVAEPTILVLLKGALPMGATCAILLASKMAVATLVIATPSLEFLLLTKVQAPFSKVKPEHSLIPEHISEHDAKSTAAMLFVILLLSGKNVSQ